MTKKDVFAKYGIEYKAGKIRAPFGKDLFIPLLLPVGTNTKVGNAATWSIYHGCETLNDADFGNKTKAIMQQANVTSIKASCPIHCKGCYCDSGNYRYDSTKASLMLKLILAKHYPGFMVNAINAQLESDDIKQVRIHAAGDFFSNEYIDAWKKIVVSNPAVTFWTYTKVDYALKAFAGISNVSIVPSITPYGFNFGTCEQLINRREKLINAGFRVHVCACGTELEKHCSDCTTGCKAIGSECDFVLFIMHSTTDYKAGKHDPIEYEQLCDIIAKQNN